MVVVNRTGSRFAATVGAFTVRMKNRTKIVWQRSILRLTDFMQTPVSAGGNMPVVTGFLRASLMASTSVMPAMIRENPGGLYTWDPGEIEALVRSAKVGTPIYLGYTAVYANKLEDRYAFQRLAVQRWPSIVAQVIAQLGREE